MQDEELTVILASFDARIRELEEKIKVLSLMIEVLENE
jgi:hypothetical protein